MKAMSLFAEDRLPTHALTLWQPMCSAIIAGRKVIENRKWSPPAMFLGKRIWIHAGSVWDKHHAEFCSARGFSVAELEVPYGAIIGSVRVVGFACEGLGHAGLTEVQAHLVRASSWWMGPFGWLLEDVLAYPSPISCAGHQKLWSPKDDVLRAARAAERESR